MSRTPLRAQKFLAASQLAPSRDPGAWPMKCNIANILPPRPCPQGSITPLALPPPFPSPSLNPMLLLFRHIPELISLGNRRRVHRRSVLRAGVADCVPAGRGHISNELLPALLQVSRVVPSGEFVVRSKKRLRLRSSALVDFRGTSGF